MAQDLLKKFNQMGTVGGGDSIFDEKHELEDIQVPDIDEEMEMVEGVKHPVPKNKRPKGDICAICGDPACTYPERIRVG